MKRWIFLILVGVVLSCFGVAKILTQERLDFLPLLEIILCFIVGFSLIIISVVQMQRRTLELLVQETDGRFENKKSEVNSLIFNKKVYEQGPKIVAIGGGNGLNAVLKGLKNYTNNITAIVTVSDYGELVPESRKILGAMPLDDIKESIIALSENETAMRNLLNAKFSKGTLKDLCFGDIYLLGMKEVYGEFTKSIEQTETVLNITGKVLPVTLEPIQICAELDDGTVVESRDKIPEVVNSKASKINRIFINPTNCKVAPGVIEAIQEADAIVIGPGSLYTNVIPNLLVKGVAKAIKESKGFKIYVSNIMTEAGQTDNFTLSDHIKVIHEHTGKGLIEYCIYDTGELIPEYIRKYNMQGQELVEIDANKAKEQGVYLMQREISCVTEGYIRHNPDAVAASIIQLICDDLKFKDMQNDTKYVLLNDRLKEAKKDLKVNRKHNNIRKTRKKAPRMESKFYKKYKDRIESIQEAEMKMKVKAGIPLEESEEKPVKEQKGQAKKAKVSSTNENNINKNNKVSKSSSNKTNKTTKKSSNIISNLIKNVSSNKSSNNQTGKHSKTIKKIDATKQKETIEPDAKEIKELEDKQKEDFINAINSLRR